MMRSTASRWRISSRCAGPQCSMWARMPRRIFSVRPVMMLSSVDMPLNRATFWKVRAMPWLRREVGAHVVAPLALEGDHAFLRDDRSR